MPMSVCNHVWKCRTVTGCRSICRRRQMGGRGVLTGAMRCSWFVLAALWVGGVLLHSTSLVLGQEETATPAEANQPELSTDYASPRQTINTFRLAYEVLKSDSKDVTEQERVFGALDLPNTVGEARLQFAVLLDTFFIGLGGDEGLTEADIDNLAPGPEEAANLMRFELFPGSTQFSVHLIEQVGSTPKQRIVLVKTDSGWRFSRESLDSLQALVDWMKPQIGQDISEPGIRGKIPDSLKRVALGLEFWQWIGLLVVLFIAVVIDFTSRLLFRPIARRVVDRYVAEPPSRAVRLAVRPLGLIVGATSFMALLHFVSLTNATALTVLSVSAQFVRIFAIVWAAWAINDLVASTLAEKAKTTETTFDDMIIPLIRKSVKLFIVALGLIYIANALEIELAPLLASFGLAGLAVSFAAQDTIKNLFGGLTIFMDRPFKIGERVKFQAFDGIVEEIGFRSTKIRTLTGHVVTIPNASLTNEPVENVGRRSTIRRVLNVTITYDTPKEKIERGVEIIRDILQEGGICEPIHPWVKGSELTPQVYFNDFNAESLNIFVIYWYAPPNYWDYLEHAQRLNLRIFEEYEKAGIEFAFPTSTMFLAGDPKRELAVRWLGKDLA